jgi:serine/threonine protein kinase
MRKRQRDRSPLSTLLQQLSLYSSDVPVDHEVVNSVLSPHVQKALAHESGAGPLLQVLQQFGWQGLRFTHDVRLDRIFERLQVFKYERLQTLGSGTYASVYKARNRETKELCAVKKMRLSGDEPGVPNTAIREISCLKDLAHPNIVE